MPLGYSPSGVNRRRGDHTRGRLAAASAQREVLWNIDDRGAQPDRHLFGQEVGRQCAGISIGGKGVTFYSKAIKQYAKFSGRASRYDFVMFIITTILLQWVASIVDDILGLLDKNGGVGVFAAMTFLFHFIPSISVLVRRIHDVGHSGWWALILLVPVVNIIPFFYFLFARSQPDSNAYGPNPYSGEYERNLIHQPPIKREPHFGSEIDQLEKLAEMRSSGTISDEEFAELKRRVMRLQNH